MRVACAQNIVFVAKKLLLHNSVGLIVAGDGAAAAGSPPDRTPMCSGTPRFRAWSSKGENASFSPARVSRERRFPRTGAVGAATRAPVEEKLPNW